MVEAITNRELVERLITRSQPDDGVVSIYGIQTKFGLLVTLAGITPFRIGIAEDDGSEEDSQEDNNGESLTEKPSDNVTLLKDSIAVRTSGNMQKVAFYLAERAGTKATLEQLAQALQLEKAIIDPILRTLRERAQANNWPLLIRYSPGPGAGFFTPNEIFRSRVSSGNKTQPLKAKAARTETASDNDRKSAEEYARKQARDGEKEILLLLASNLGEKISFERLIKVVNPCLELSGHGVKIREYLKIIETLKNIRGFEKNQRNPFYLEVDERRNKLCVMHKNPDFRE